ncbi:LPS-assembly protein LptD [Oceanibium sediminis]|uniref:LPS-assembly protein LptD n=1 Tax=Oceanibium sediminis TaxID=2026339 RepID=UPI000DD2B983|nr:LPS assembly protein LptD [Oceanibium sediminis]
MTLLPLVIRSLALLVCLHVAAQAQDAPPATLYADNLRYDTANQQVIATGDVEATFGPYRLQADTLRYDARAGTLEASGAIRLRTPEGMVLLASLAELSTDFREGLIEGARLIFDQQFQVAAATGQRSAGRFTSLNTAVASSCTVCIENPTPIWRIRARTVVHDEQTQRLYFDHVVLDAFGVPVLYLPKLSVPEPGVTRAPGFLIPSLSTSESYGIGAKLPYFLPMGDHADVTLTPFVTTDDAILLEGQYRHRFAAGRIRIDGAFALNDGQGERFSRGYVDAAGQFTLPRDFDLEFQLNRASDRSFLGQFNYSDADRLESFASVSRIRRNSRFDLRTEAYQTLREDEQQSEIPFVLPSATYRRTWSDTRIGGTLGVEADFLTLQRESGRDVMRLGLGVDWRGETTLSNGIRLSSVLGADVDAYSVNNDPTFGPGTLVRTTPFGAVTLRWPLARQGARAIHVIEPMVQLVYSDSFGDRDVPNEDSLLPEFDTTNLLSLNRFPGRDRREQGFRVNSGISYTRIDPLGWSIGATIGRVFKPDADQALFAGSGLRPAASNYVAALSLDIADRFSLVGRSLFDDRLEFRRGEFEFDYTTPGFDVGAAYTYLSRDDSDPLLGLLNERREISFESRYRFRPNWELDAAWTYDLADDRSISASGGITFGNECLLASFGVSRSFTSANDVPQDTRLSLEVELAGVGSSSSEGWPARQCQGI